jgi:polyphosphate kinase 2 (PPK2 family)
MIDRTDKDRAPWFIIPSNDKYFARVAVLRAVIERLEDELD